MLKILVLCTGNSCRSVMAEGLLNHYGKDKILAFSAGSFPTGNVHPMSLATLKRHGMSDQGYRSKSWDEFKDQPIDILITVCDNAAGEVCPIFPGKPIKAHWGVPDPAHYQGTPTEIEAEFDRIFTMLEKRVKAFLRLPLEKIDKDELQQKLNEIGTL
ncbi:MAG: arsenate reductase ArsC [Rickettsiales bacterium]|jgi:arsenate reductase|nr:arsenate reductase ArsC [Rickettsiales bacterium]